MSATNYDSDRRNYKRELPFRTHGDHPIRQTDRLVPDEEEEEEEHPINLASAWDHRGRSYKVSTSEPAARHPPHSPFSAVALPPFSFTPKDRIDTPAGKDYPVSPKLHKEVVKLEHNIEVGLKSAQKRADETYVVLRETTRFERLCVLLRQVEANRMALWIYAVLTQTKSLVHVGSFIEAQSKVNMELEKQLEAKLKPYEDNPRSRVRQAARDDFSHTRESDNLQAALSALKYRHDLLAKLFKLISNLIRQPRMVNRDEGGHPAAMKQVMVEKIVKECAIPPIDWVEDKGFSPLPPSEE